MDLVRAQYARLSGQLVGLSASQKMLTITLLAIMIGTVIWWGNYAAQPEMEPVLNQAMSAEEIGSIKDQLDARGIKASVLGDKILVSAEKKYEALALLGESHALPVDTRTGFDDMITKMSPWDLPSKNDRLWNEAKQRTLAQIIRRFHGVDNATILIDADTHRSFSNPTEASATVSISMRHGEKIGAKQVEGAADLVAGATAGLKRSRVTVVVDGVPYPVADRDGDTYVGSTDIIEQKRASEKSFEDKIRQQLSFIPQVLVSVTVDLNTKTMQETKHEVDPKTSLQLETETTETTEETKNPAANSGEPGVIPNTGASVAQGTSSGDGGTNKTENKSTFHVEPATTDIVTKMPAGDATVTAASVRVPRSWFVSVYKAQNPKATGEPDDAALTTLVATELPRIKNDVLKCTGLKNEQDVAVETFVDVSPAYAMAVEEKSSPSPVVATISVHSREVALGALAVVSLFMVMMMVRKSTPAPMIPVAAAPEATPEPGILEAGEELVGEAGSGDPMLDGMELDDDAIKTQQMLDQVSTMVKDNPDSAAALVKRWLNK